MKNPFILRLTEFAAVALSLLYTWLYLHNDILCFWFGGAGAILFAFLCFRKRIYADATLQLFYVGFAVYGYWQYGGAWHSTRWTLSYHLVLLAAGCMISAIAAMALQRFTRAALPWIDAPVAVFSVIATWAMVNYVPENWIYWIAINAASAVLYAWRGLWMGSLMFLVYLAMALDGYFVWNLF